MILNFDALLSDPLSDKEAYVVVTFITELALALESHYFAQIRRYNKETEGIPTQYYNGNDYPF